MDELEVIQAIFPEASLTNDNTVSISIPIRLNTPITLVSGGRSCSVSVLPSLIAQITLPDGYPETKAPQITFYGVKSWLSTSKEAQLKENLAHIWNTIRDSIVYSWIDELKTGAETGYDVNSPLEVSETSYSAIVDANSHSLQSLFDSESFSCGICLNSRRGKDCSQFECGHVFCKNCLGSLFEEKIRSGEVGQVHCPDFLCTKRFVEQDAKIMKGPGENETLDEYEKRFFEMPVDIQMLENIVGKSMAERYAKFFRQWRFKRYSQISRTRILKCPREKCARMFLLQDSSNLAECPACGFAFCRKCLHSWHGANNSCFTASNALGVKVAQEWLECDPGSQAQHKVEIIYGKLMVHREVKNYLKNALATDLVGRVVKSWETGTSEQKQALIYKYGQGFVDEARKRDVNDKVIDNGSKFVRMWMDAPPGSERRRVLESNYGSQFTQKAFKQYNDDKKFRQWVESTDDAAMCPGCNAVVQKTEGCDHMDCPVCNTCFCYRCGTNLSRPSETPSGGAHSDCIHF